MANGNKYTRNKRRQIIMQVGKKEVKEFEALTAVAINVAIFWDIAPCSQYVNRRF
jgi:hypothetical protein